MSYCNAQRQSSSPTTALRLCKRLSKAPYFNMTPAHSAQESLDPPCLSQMQAVSSWAVVAAVKWLAFSLIANTMGYSSIPRGRFSAPTRRVQRQNPGPSFSQSLNDLKALRLRRQRHWAEAEGLRPRASACRGAPAMPTTADKITASDL